MTQLLEYQVSHLHLLKWAGALKKMWVRTPRLTMCRAGCQLTGRQQSKLQPRLVFRTWSVIIVPFTSPGGVSLPLNRKNTRILVDLVQSMPWQSRVSCEILFCSFAQDDYCDTCWCFSVIELNHLMIASVRRFQISWYSLVKRLRVELIYRWKYISFFATGSSSDVVAIVHAISWRCLSFMPEILILASTTIIDLIFARLQNFSGLQHETP